MKNYFYNKETTQEYENTWVDIFEKDDEIKKYWDMELDTGRIKRAMIDIFFDSYFQIFIQNKIYNITNEDKLMYSRVDTLFSSYQHFINKYCDGNKKVILEHLKDYATCFMKTFRPEYCQMAIPCSYGIERINIIIFGLKNTTLIPYFLYLVKNVSSTKELNKMCSIIESYIMRRIIVHASTKNYNNLFTSLILNCVSDAQSLYNKLSSFRDNTTLIPSDLDLEDAFRNIKLYNIQAKGILYMLESLVRSPNSATSLLGFNSYSLEHLMPKKWRNKWPACESDEIAQRRDSILLTLGNLAIIPQRLNISIRDANWEKKKNGNDDKQGLCGCATGLVTLSNALEQIEWNEEKILERADWLCEMSKKVWNINIE